MKKMEKWIENLLSLQETDLRIRNLRLRLEMIPEEIRRLGMELEDNKKKLDLTKENCMRFDLDMKKVEGSIKEKNVELQRIQAQSAMVKKNEEYKALLSEIENVKKKISGFETEQLVLMDKTEEEKKKFRDVERVFNDRSKSIRDEKTGLEDLVARLKEEIVKLEILRDEKRKPLPQNVLSLYSRLLSKGSSSPFVQVSQGMCGKCHLKLTPQTVNSARKELMTQCDNCGHMIYFAE